jgi:hypothetical protein
MEHRSLAKVVTTLKSAVEVSSRAVAGATSLFHSSHSIPFVAKLQKFQVAQGLAHDKERRKASSLLLMQVRLSAGATARPNLAAMYCQIQIQIQTTQLGRHQGPL